MAKKKATKKKVVRKAGRPPKFNQLQKETMLRLAPLGFSNDEMADMIGCVRSTFYKWLQDDQELSDALRIAKSLADSELIQTSFDKAMGRCKTTEIRSGICPNTGNLIETKIVKEIPPSDTMLKFMLLNRQPDKYKDKREVELGTSEIKINIDSDDVGL